jgi:outer membrane protein
MFIHFFCVILILFTFSVSGEVLDLEFLITESIKKSEGVQAEDFRSEKAVYERKSTAMKFFPKTSVELKMLDLSYYPEPKPMMIDVSPVIDVLNESINESSPIPIDFPESLPPVEAPIEMPDHQRQLEVKLIQPVTNLWEIYQGYKAKDLVSEVHKLKATLKKEEVRRTVTGYYHTYNMVGEVLELIKETENQFERYERTAKKFIDSGMSDRQPLLKIKVEQASVAVEKEKYSGLRSVIKSAIALMIERDEKTFEIKSEKPLFVKLNTTPDQLVSRQAESRLEYKLLMKSDEIRDRLDKISLQPLMPQIAFTLGFRKNWDHTYIDPEGLFFIGGVLNWNFGFPTAGIYFDTKAVKAESIAIKLDNIKIKKDMELQARKLHAEISLLEKTIELNTRQIEAAEESLRIEEAKFEKQMTTETELLNTSLILRKARTEKISNLYRHSIAVAQLSSITGVSSGLFR